MLVFNPPATHSLGLLRNIEYSEKKRIKKLNFQINFKKTVRPMIRFPI
jgi:hypothetical protein